MNKTVVIIGLFLFLQGLLYRSVALAPTPNIANADEMYLIFQDEFNGDSLDWNNWESVEANTTSASGQKVYRGSDNAVVEDGLLKLMNKKESVNGSEWTAAYVWLRETYGINTYYETRFINTTTSGINNAFWTAVKTTVNSETRNFENRYEIDCPENKLHTDGKIHAHLAWHDWKTYSYAGKDIAQGISLTLDNDGFQTWGLWIGETGFAIYLNGVKQWDGTTHPSYTTQYCTGVGKLSSWPTDEEQRAYGKYGQDDWCYYGGYNGDNMNICFSTMPWENSASPLTDDAHNTFMGIDYLRVFKLKKDSITEPLLKEEMINGDEELSLITPIVKDANSNTFFSFVIHKKQASSFSLSLRNADTESSSFTISESNELMISSEDVTVSTSNSYPANLGQKVYMKQGGDYLVIGRVTASVDKRSMVSYKTFELGKLIPSRELFLYHNVDNEGNTSITSGWDLSKKINLSEDVDRIQFDFDDSDIEITNFRLASNYLAVIEDYCDKPTASIEAYIRSNADRKLSFTMFGDQPFTLVYTDGVQDYTIENIQSKEYTVAVNPVSTTTYTLVGVSDKNGQEGVVGGKATIIVPSDVDYTQLFPSFDTYFSEGGSASANSMSSNMTVSKSDMSESKCFFTFDIPVEAATSEEVLFNIYLLSGATTDNFVFRLGVSDYEVISTSSWSDLPQDAFSARLVTQNTASRYLSFDVTATYNEALAVGKDKLNFTLSILSEGEVSATFKQGNETSTSVPAYLFVKKKRNTGVASFSSHAISIFPNPSDGTVNVSQLLDHGITTIEVFNLSGMKVRDYSIKSPILDLNLKRGMYIIKVSSDYLTLIIN